MRMEFIYRTNYPVSAADVAELFISSGIRRPSDDLARIQTMLDHGNLTITAWQGNQLVGIGRALTDFSFCCYLSDLAVRKSFQRQGIGQAIIGKIQGIIGPDVTFLLLSAPEAMTYYPHIGLAHADNAWILQRQT